MFQVKINYKTLSQLFHVLQERKQKLNLALVAQERRLRHIRWGKSLLSCQVGPRGTATSCPKSGTAYIDIKKGGAISLGDHHGGTKIGRCTT